ncbi:MAG: ATP/GTP-binding protein [gamma proteobacterium endosymbiont of Lamellibrachia anaximandri]|nr:ATP/GTP-binding protein [gamma proteobacterium endosymbiont of Lamellibrachia anaximandri]
MKKDLKIIFTGPVGAGKTTAINAISDTDTVSTNESSTDELRYRKNTTTVAMDYGIINMVDNKRVHLYGTPGQERFDFMWDILIQGGMGLVLLVDNARPDPLEDMQFFLQRFGVFIQRTRVAIGVTRMDISSTPRLNEYQALLNDQTRNIPLFEVDARVRQDVSILVQSLLHSLDHQKRG